MHDHTVRFEMRIGLLVIGGMVAIVLMILASDIVSFEGRYRVTAYLQDAAGLKPGSPVSLAGIRVGKHGARSNYQMMYSDWYITQ